MASVTPFLWFTQDLAQVLAYYQGVFTSGFVVESTNRVVEEGPVDLATVNLFGQRVTLMSSPGPLALNETFSFTLGVDTQDELDAYWDALADGGEEQACGWVKDRFGLCWQVNPRELADWIVHPDAAVRARVQEVVFSSVKLDFSKLHEALVG